MAEMLSSIKQGTITLLRKYIDDYNYTSYVTVITGIINSSLDMIVQINPLLKVYCWLGFLVLLACHGIIYEWSKKSHPYKSWKDTTWFIGLIFWLALLFLIWGFIVPDRLIYKQQYLIVFFSFITTFCILAIYEVALYWKTNLTLPMVDSEYKSRKICTVILFLSSLVIVTGGFLILVSFLSPEYKILYSKFNW